MCSISNKNNIFEEIADLISDPDLVLLESEINSFNLMGIFNISTYEPATSSFLRWLLDPKENHGLDDYFLRYFLIECAKIDENLSIFDVDNLDTNDAIVITEEYFNKYKADITIRIEEKKLFCLIEDKIKSAESKGQTRKYLKLSKRKYDKYNIYLYVYLTPFGDIPEAKEDFIIMSYYEIRDLLEQTIIAKKDHINFDILFVLKQFLKNIEVNILKEGKIKEMCDKIYLRHKKAIDTIISYLPDAISIMKEEIANKLGNEWEFNPSSTKCEIFKKSWLEDFGGFSDSRIPPFHYQIIAHGPTKSLFRLEFHVDAVKEIRDEFRTDFGDIMDLKYINFKNKLAKVIYRKGPNKQKFKIQISGNDYEKKEDLELFSASIDSWIRNTLKLVESSIDQFKNEKKMKIIKWKEYLQKK